MQSASQSSNKPDNKLMYGTNSRVIRLGDIKELATDYGIELLSDENLEHLIVEWNELSKMMETAKQRALGANYLVTMEKDRVKEHVNFIARLIANKINIMGENFVFLLMWDIFNDNPTPAFMLLKDSTDGFGGNTAYKAFAAMDIGDSTENYYIYNTSQRSITQIDKCHLATVDALEEFYFVYTSTDTFNYGQLVTAFDDRTLMTRLATPGSLRAWYKERYDAQAAKVLIDRVEKSERAYCADRLTRFLNFMGIEGTSQTITPNLYAMLTTPDIYSDPGFNEHFYRIPDVITLADNRRLVIYYRVYYQNNYYKKPTDPVYIYFNIKVIPDSHELWQNMDAGAFMWFFKTGINQYYRPDSDSLALGNYVDTFDGLQTIIYDDEKPIVLPDVKLLEKYAKHLHIGDRTVFLDAAGCARLGKTVEIQEIREKTGETADTTMKKKWDERLRKIREDGTLSITINDVTYSKSKIIYQGQELSFTGICPLDLITSTARYASSVKDITYNWDNCFDEFMVKIDYIMQSTSVIGDQFTGVIGTIPFKVDIRGSNAQNQAYASRLYYVNDIKINKEEVVAVLRRALCYNNLPDYTAFLQLVSRCSLKIHGWLHRGLTATVKDERIGVTLIVDIALDRIDNKNFVVHGNEKYPIHDINGLAGGVSRAKTLRELEGILTSPDIVEINLANIRHIIKVGKDAHIEAIQKAKELLEKTLRRFKLQEENRQIGGQLRSGYVIHGQLRDYFLANTQDATVFNLASGHSICIVEKNGHGADPKDQVGVDKLVNRIYALVNDSLIANEVGTLVNPM